MPMADEAYPLPQTLAAREHGVAHAEPMWVEGGSVDGTVAITWHHGSKLFSAGAGQAKHMTWAAEPASDSGPDPGSALTAGVALSPGARLNNIDEPAPLPWLTPAGRRSVTDGNKQLAVHNV